MSPCSSPRFRQDCRKNSTVHLGQSPFNVNGWMKGWMDDETDGWKHVYEGCANPNPLTPKEEDDWTNRHLKHYIIRLCVPNYLVTTYRIQMIFADDFFWLPRACHTMYNIILTHTHMHTPCPPKNDFQEWENVTWENGLKLVARVKQHPLVHHAVHTHYDSVVNETSS
jgi:hypothetical protein